MAAPELNETRAKYVAPIDEAELALCMLEAAGQMRRPDGVSARQLLDSLDEIDRSAWLRAAKAAMAYWARCIADANRTS